MDRLTLRTMAKINLGLDVVRRMENGYHQVRMIMQSVDLYDELTFERTERGILLETDNETLPVDHNNLICRAAELIAAQHPFGGGVKITLKKRIPMAAGMAGGSADAAAVFHGLDRLFALGMDTEEMHSLAARIGPDVPGCIAGGTTRSEGIGEILTPLPEAPEAHLVIAKPDISVSTGYVYENLHVERIERHPDIDSVEAAIRGNDLDGMCAHMEIILETVTEKEYPIISEIKCRLNKKGAVTALMSGSGPTVFGIFRTRRQAEDAFADMEKSGLAKELFITGFAEKAWREI